jgi:hypothetical protein
MHLVLGQVEVQFDTWSRHGLGYWYKLYGTGLLVQFYNSISHSDSVALVSSFYL